MDKLQKPRLIDVLIFDDVNILDVGGPVQAFVSALANNKRRYHHRYVSLDGKPVKANCGLTLNPDAKLSASSKADDLLVPGGEGVDALLENEKLQSVISGWADRPFDCRLISICSGSLLLAASGVLDQKEATTHWSREVFAKTQFPKTRWNIDKIYTMSEQIYTSAGVSTGIDLALSIIGKDCGTATALDVAQELVVYLKRSGGQGQFSNFLNNQYELRSDISTLVTKIIDDPAAPWTLATMADETSLSSRTLSRKFIHQMGLTPVQFVEQTRADYARNLLSNGVSLQTAASVSGFGDLQRMRRSFKRLLGLSAKEYAERFELPHALSVGTDGRRHSEGRFKRQRP